MSSGHFLGGVGLNILEDRVVINDDVFRTRKISGYCPILRDISRPNGDRRCTCVALYLRNAHTLFCGRLLEEKLSACRILGAFSLLGRKGGEGARSQNKSKYP